MLGRLFDRLSRIADLIYVKLDPIRIGQSVRLSRPVSEKGLWAINISLSGETIIHEKLKAAELETLLHALVFSNEAEKVYTIGHMEAAISRSNLTVFLVLRLSNSKDKVLFRQADLEAAYRAFHDHMQALSEP